MSLRDYRTLLSHAHINRADKTGSPSATTAILLIGDVFGNVAQTLQVRHFVAHSLCRAAIALTLPKSSGYRVLISWPMVARAPTNTKSSFRTSCRVSMPVTLGFRQTRKKSSKPLARTLVVLRISERPRRRSRQSSRKSSGRQKAQSPNGQLSGFAGVGKYDWSLRPFTPGFHAQVLV